MDKVFTYAKPEEVGISSKVIYEFIESLEKDGLNMHSIMIVRNGKIITEGYWKPFDKNFRHRMYSVSKSFVAGAIGILLDEGKISLKDRVCSFFPEYSEESLHKYTKETTIRDLLIMATPFELTYSLWGNGRNRKYWVESFFTANPTKPAGTIFCYDTTASFMLNVIVERITGKPFMDFLYEKILYKLGFSENPKCINSPDGYSWGGSGVLCTTLDLAKYAYIFLKGGKVNGEQLLSENFVKEAIKKQIESDTFGIGQSFYTAMGYGYQIWRTEYNGFAFNGMGNQHAWCYPDKDLMIICTADNQGRQPEAARDLKCARIKIIENCTDRPLEENNEYHEKLQKKLSSLSLRLPEGDKTSDFAKNIEGKKYTLLENSLGWKWIQFEFNEREGVLHYENARGKKALFFGYGEYIEGELPESQYSGDTIDTPLGRGYKYVGAGVWPSETHLLLRINTVDDYIGNLNLSFAFTDNKVGIRATKTAEGFLDDYNGLAGGEY